jgi:hypothetical protein
MLSTTTTTTSKHVLGDDTTITSHIKGEFISLLPFRGRIPVIINKLPSACRNTYTAGCYTARKHTHAECTTPLRDTLYSMYNYMYHRPLDSAFDAHLIHLRDNLAFSHQACDSRLITLYNNNTSFQRTCKRGRPDARAIFQHTSRSALQARDHSNAFSPYTRRAYLLRSAQA